MASNKEPGAQRNARLERIETQWSLLRLAHADSVTAAGEARNALVLRYCDAIRRFVGSVLQNDPDADDLTQDIVVRMLGGDFAGADPERGRFRSLLKLAVRNMIRNDWKRRQRQAPADWDLDRLSDQGASQDRWHTQWTEAWRTAVLDRTWSALEALERDHPGSSSWTILRQRAEHPEDDSAQLAARVSKAIGRTMNSAALRQQLRRARIKFAQLLLEETARGLDQATPDEVQKELGELGLMEFVRDFLPHDWTRTGQLAEDAEP